MTLNLTIPQQTYADFTPRITVIGVGGGGTNAVDNMIQSNLQGVDFVVANTDAQQLTHSLAERRIQLGPHLTQGLGAGAKPEIGKAAAEEAADEIARHMEGAHMVFVTAGMGGGTGTGAAPVIARMARERDILTVGVVTKPFSFEGIRRAKAAEAGLAELQQYVDTLIVIPNQNLFMLANEKTGFKEAFKMADHVLYMGVRGVTDLMVSPGLINLDFADIRTIMAEMGKAMMGTGEADGDNRAIRAAEAAISNPLLEDTSMAGARGLLINITGGEDMTLMEVEQAAERIREEVAEDANIIFGSAIDDRLEGKVRVSVVATGIDTPPPSVATKPIEAETSPVQEASTTYYQTPPASQNGFFEPLSTTAQPNQGNVGHSVSSQPVSNPPPQAPSNNTGVQHHATPLHQQAEPSQQASHYSSGGNAPQAAGLASNPYHAPSPNSIPVKSGTQNASVPPRSGLFSETARDAEPPAAPSRSLFGIVTGALRRNILNTPPPQPPREREAPKTEPSINKGTSENAPGHFQPNSDDAGLEIPAFLRRKSF
ncbi:cell division protein FtsZ [Entomobacter blattae]|uniref:Cell division protein FtsZ n=1 Tax=Entomobacter blattae TaxID=2762277 RepID=A0A7H1NNS6_9PROT|nr:cell division protein FtsZ [Entomobacter blattae]QNT77436.1 Cell division protein FtsZ [Entomobacter blattae]